MEPEETSAFDGYNRLGMYDSATMFAEKLYARNGSTAEEILRLARLSFEMNDTARALRVLYGPARRQLDAPSRILAAQCYLRQGDYERCLSAVHEDSPQDELKAPREVSSSLCILRAKAYELIGNTQLAKKWYEEGLYRDRRCFTALNRLISRALVSQKDAIQLVESLFPKEKQQHLYHLYRCVVLAEDPSQQAFEESMGVLKTEHGLGESPRVLFLKAQRAYARRKYDACLDLTESLLETGMGDEQNTLLHVAALSKVRGSELSNIAHRLEEEKPQSPLACLTIGYYYLHLDSGGKAKRYLQKATVLDPEFVSAWIALGHTMSSQDDSDGALNAYRTAARLMPASALPLLYSGMEHLRLRSTLQAERFLLLACTSTNWDPAPLYELGVLKYQLGLFSEGIDLFTKALDRLDRENYDDEILQATYLGLGHCRRRLGRLAEAREWYEQAVAIDPSVASTRTAIGMTFHGEGNLFEAITIYHTSLRIQPRDSVTLELLEDALEEIHTSNPPLNITNNTKLIQ